MDAQAHAHAFSVIQFRLGNKVAGINEVHGVDASFGLAGAVCCQGHKRLHMVACLPAQGRYGMFSLCDLVRGDMSFSCPAAVQCDQVKIFIVHVQAGTEDFFQIEFFPAFIDGCHAASNGIGIFKNAVAQQYL